MNTYRLDEFLDWIIPQTNMSITSIECKMFIIRWLNRSKLDPTKAGCWFCHRDGADYFTCELDAYFHPECLWLERKNRPDNPELESFNAEFPIP